jgi:hypothetical protein
MTGVTSKVKVYSCCVPDETSTAMVSPVPVFSIGVKIRKIFQHALHEK